MAVSRLDIENLRCIAGARLDLGPRQNLIFGVNGAGKTSVLEAAYVLGRGHSFRVRDNRRLVREGTSGFVVRCRRDGQTVGQRLGLAYSRGALKVHIDGHRAASATQLAGMLPVEVIDPASHRLIDGGPGERRRFVDWALFHVEPGYIDWWRAYRRALLQRNEALRRGVSDRELAPWDDALLDAAARLERVRGAFVERWGRLAGEIGERLLSTNVTLQYRGGLGRYDSLAAALRGARTSERERGLTLHGPHRSDVVVQFGNGSARAVASRGQQKLLAATLVLARLHDRLQQREADGLLLVDDPAAELDAGGLGRLIDELAALPVQMLVTSIERKALAALPEPRTFHVEQGAIEAV